MKTLIKKREREYILSNQTFKKLHNYSVLNQILFTNIEKLYRLTHFKYF